MELIRGDRLAMTGELAIELMERNFFSYPRGEWTRWLKLENSLSFEFFSDDSALVNMNEVKTGAGFGGMFPRAIVEGMRKRYLEIEENLRLTTLDE